MSEAKTQRDEDAIRQRFAAVFRVPVAGLADQPASELAQALALADEQAETYRALGFEPEPEDEVAP